MRQRSNSEQKAMFAAMAEERIGRYGPRKAREALIGAADRVDEALYRVAVEFDNQPVDEESANARARALKGALSELENAEMHFERTVQETGHLWKEEDPGQDVGDEFDDEYEEEPPVNDLERIRRQNRNAERASAEVSTEEWGPQPDRPSWVPDNIDEILAEEGPVDDEWGETPLNDIQRILRQNRIAERISEEMAEELNSKEDYPYWVPDNIEEILTGGSEDPKKDRPKASARAGGKGSRDKKSAKREPTDLEMTFVKEAPPRLLEEFVKKLLSDPYPVKLDPPLDLPEKLTDHKPDLDFVRDRSPGGKKYEEMSRKQGEETNRAKRGSEMPPAHVVNEVIRKAIRTTEEEATNQMRLGPDPMRWSEDDPPARLNPKDIPETPEGLERFAGEAASKLGFNLNDEQRKWVAEKGKSGGKELIKEVLTAIKKAINKRKAATKAPPNKGRGPRPAPQDRHGPLAITVRGKKITVPDFMIKFEVPFSTKDVEDFILDRLSPSNE